MTEHLTERIAFTIPGVPCAQPRARATTISGQARMYEAVKSHPIHTFKAAVKLAAGQAYNGPPLDCPLKLSACFVFPRTKEITWKTKPMLRCPAPSKRVGDTDNLLKGLFDALNGQVFVDDALVCAAMVSKEYAAGDEQAHVTVVIERV